MSPPHHSDALIIGGGPAAYTAAIYAARAGLQPLVIEGLQPGGQLTTTTDVENWPGETTILGPALMRKMRDQATHFGARLIADDMAGIDLVAPPFRCTTASGTVYGGACAILATGAQARWLGLPGEDAYRGYGVSACATCDGFFFRGRHVVVIGGGNSAVEEALYLTRHAARVTLIHRRDRLRAEKVLQERIKAHARIDILWNCVVDEIAGDGDPPRVTAVNIRDTVTGIASVVPCDGIFVAIGHRPATELFRGQIALDGDGYIVTQAGSTATSVPGVFAAGDVADPHYRQAVTAAGSGCMAAIDAQRFLAAAAEGRRQPA